MNGGVIYRAAGTSFNHARYAAHAGSPGRAADFCIVFFIADFEVEW
jgi:hypothetical protein